MKCDCMYDRYIYCLSAIFSDGRGTLLLDRLLYAVLMIPLIFLAACGKEDVAEEINDHLEETVEIEKEFEVNQEKIFELEKEDEELYNKIISLDGDDKKKVRELSDEAIGLLDERLEYAKLEKESLEKSREEFEKVEPLIEKVEEDDEKELLEKMFDTMIERYEAYEEVHEQYSDSVRLTKDLYTLFKEEEFNENQVYSVIGNVNDSYDEVQKANDRFNKETALYNELKLEYYDASDNEK